MQIPYTKPMENVIKQAGKIARERKHPYIGTEHLLLALRKEYSGVAGQVLAKNGVDAEKISQTAGTGTDNIPCWQWINPCPSCTTDAQIRSG